MPYKLLEKSLQLLLRRQTNILSAAFIIMVTVILSQILGLVRQRLLVAIFGASDTLGVYLVATKIPDTLFQLIVAGALSSAFIPVFSDFLEKGKDEEGYKMASGLLLIGMCVFFVFSLLLFLFAPFFVSLLNQGKGFTPDQLQLMVSLMRIIILSQFLFIIGTFFSALLQSYNHFFIPGIAAACYNLGIIIGIILFSSVSGIYAPAYGMILGALLFILVQLPMIKNVGFRFYPTFSLATAGVKEVVNLMWPRTLSIGVFQLGTIAIIVLMSYLSSSGRNVVIYDYAQTLAFAPVALFGQAIAQAAFPVLARERDRLEQFKATFVVSFNQLLYLVLPFSALIIVLRIPIVRLVFGAGQFDWQATVLTGQTLALLGLSIFAQALIYLASRAFYALHDTKTPLIVGTLTTALMILLGYMLVIRYDLGVQSIATAYSITGVVHLVILMVILDRKTGGFNRAALTVSWTKIIAATFFTGFALYIPIKLLDQLVFDTTRTINLLALTGISTGAGLSLYLFLTWLFNVKEATTYILIFKKLGNWKSILGESEEVIDRTRVNP